MLLVQRKLWFRFSQNERFDDVLQQTWWYDWNIALSKINKHFFLSLCFPSGLDEYLNKCIEFMLLLRLVESKRTSFVGQWINKSHGRAVLCCNIWVLFIEIVVIYYSIEGALIIRSCIIQMSVGKWSQVGIRIFMRSDFFIEWCEWLIGWKSVVIHWLKILYFNNWIRAGTWLNLKLYNIVWADKCHRNEQNILGCDYGVGLVINSIFGFGPGFEANWMQAKWKWRTFLGGVANVKWPSSIDPWLVITLSKKEMNRGQMLFQFSREVSEREIRAQRWTSEASNSNQIHRLCHHQSCGIVSSL